MSKDFTKIMDSRIKNALAGQRKPFRAKLTALNTKPSPNIQLAQAEGLQGEMLQSTEVMQHFGFTSGVPADSEMMVLPMGGKSVSGVIIATENAAYRVAVAQGEVCIYNQWGAKITLKQEKIIEIECDELLIKAKDKVDIQTQTLTGTATDIQLNGALAVKGDTTQEGGMSASGDIKGGTVSLKEHTHKGVSPGSGDSQEPNA